MKVGSGVGADVGAEDGPGVVGNGVGWDVGVPDGTAVVGIELGTAIVGAGVGNSQYFLYMS